MDHIDRVVRIEGCACRRTIAPLVAGDLRKQRVQSVTLLLRVRLVLKVCAVGVVAGRQGTVGGESVTERHDRVALPLLQLRLSGEASGGVF